MVVDKKERSSGANTSPHGSVTARVDRDKDGIPPIVACVGSEAMVHSCAYRLGKSGIRVSGPGKKPEEAGAAAGPPIPAATSAADKDKRGSDNPTSPRKGPPLFL